MTALIGAFARALRSLRTPGMFWHLVWPTLAAAALWLVLGLSLWDWAVAAATATVAGWPWLGDWMAASAWLATFIGWMIALGLALLSVLLFYLTAVLLVSAIAVPMMLERVGRTEYPHLEQKRGGSNLGSAVNALSAGLLFVVALTVTLPLWLIPGMSLVISVTLTAWLNRRTFAYDALMLHADARELVEVPQRHAHGLFVLGVACALLAHVPLLNLIAPALTALVYVHHVLAALERARQGGGGPQA